MAAEKAARASSERSTPTRMVRGASVDAADGGSEI
jgi:hypothetical protein